MKGLHLLYVVFLMIGFSLCVQGKGVHLSVSSNWKDSPLSLEFYEALEQLPHKPGLEFLKSYSPLEESDPTDESIFNHLLETASPFFLSEHHEPMVKYAVASRYFNPLVATHLLVDFFLFRYE